MNLILDQGNTMFKVALFDGIQLVVSERFSYGDNSKFVNWIKKNSKSPLKVIIGSVIHVKIDLSELNIVQLVELSHETKIPISNLYLTPKTLGLDRLANAVGAWCLNPNKNNLIIDMGTCIKYDLINSENQYLGGNISVGMQMRYESFHHFTDQLPYIKNREVDFNFGKNTESSLICGVQLAINHEINGFIDQYNEQFPHLTIFMTGGDLKYFDKSFKKRIFANSNLTLIGLNEILRYNA